MSMKKCSCSGCGIACAWLAPPVAAQIFSWDPLKDVQEALPEGVPSESQDHSGEDSRCGRCRRTRSPRSTRSLPAPAGPSNARPAMPCSAPSGSSSSSPAAPPARAWSSTIVPSRQTFMKMLQVQGGLGFGVNQNRLIFVFTNEQALQQLHQPGLGVRRPGQPVRHGRRPGHAVQRRGRGVARRVPLPADADRPFGHAYGRRHEVLQGRRSELKRSLR